jgi:hypothetical protein
VLSHVDCGSDVDHDAVFPPSTDVTTHVADAEALLCT